MTPIPLPPPPPPPLPPLSVPLPPPLSLTHSHHPLAASLPPPPPLPPPQLPPETSQHGMSEDDKDRIMTFQSKTVALISNLYQSFSLLKLNNERNNVNLNNDDGDVYIQREQDAINMINKASQGNYYY